MNKKFLLSPLLYLKLLFFLEICIFCNVLNAEQVLFFQKQNENHHLWEKVYLATKFYGLKAKHYEYGETINKLNLAQTVEKNKQTRCIVLTPSVFKNLTKKEYNNIDKSINILIYGLTSDKTNLDLSSQFATDFSITCSTVPKTFTPRSVFFAKNNHILKELSNQRFPFKFDHPFYIETNRKEYLYDIISLDNKHTRFPIFSKIQLKDRHVFISTDLAITKKARPKLKTFLELSPLLIYLKFSCSDFIWHRPEDTANLTIDDPWLINPYGYLNYHQLCLQMKKNNFHTTIAFIPWNYNRSHPEVIDLFKRFSNKLSICMHGNNHDHREFYKYTTQVNDPWPAKPLIEHEYNVRQGLARMDKLTELTGLPFEKVMVFPHGISPPKTLEILKKYQFISTVNDGNVPLNEKKSTNPLFHLRPVTTGYYGFPSLHRVSAHIIREYDIAMDLFLDNPILIYGHHDLFKNGYDIINKKVGYINTIQPKIKWRSLGDLSRRFYYIKKTKKNHFDLEAYADEISVDDTFSDKTYYIRAKGNKDLIKNKTINKRVDKKNTYLLKLDKSIGESKKYGLSDKDKNVDIDISQSNLRIKLLRWFSDFRDLKLSKKPFDKFVSFYYSKGIYKYGLTVIICFVIFITGAASVVFIILRRRKKAF